MGIFSIFKGSKVRDDKKIAKGLAVIKNAKAIKEDRGAWIEYFKGLDDADAAVPALLQRFEYSLEHGINDTREKESCMNGIVAFGDAALPYVTEHLLTTSRIAWPRALLSVASRSTARRASLSAAPNIPPCASALTSLNGGRPDC